MSTAPRTERFELPGHFADFPVRGTLLRPAPELQPRAPCLVQVHGYTAHQDHGFLPELSRRCAAAGLAAVRFDFSGDGRRADGSIDEGVVGRNTYRAELGDLATLRDWLRARPDLDPARLGIAGHSRGGAMALVHAAESRAAGLPHRAVATWAAMDGILRFSRERLAQWRSQGHIDVLHHTLRRRVRLQRSVLDDAEAQRDRLDVRGSAARLGAPLLVVHGRRDRAVEAACAEHLAAAASAAPDGAELVWIDDAGHAFGARDPLHEIPPRLETLLATSLRFFVDHLVRHGSANRADGGRGWNSPSQESASRDSNPPSTRPAHGVGSPPVTQTPRMSGVLTDSDRPLRIETAADAVDCGRRAARAAVSRLRRLLEQQSAVRLVLATGASQFELLRQLTAADLDWSRVTAFHLDEYVGLTADHPASFRHYLRERFVDALPGPLDAFHELRGEVDDLQAECARVGRELAAAPIDLLLCGIGENGHLAFNDPPADFDTTAPYLLVGLDEACRRQQLGEGWFRSLADVPSHALSMSIRQILAARAIVCTVPDARKAAAVQGALTGPIRPELPASALRAHDDVALFLDPGSASLLPER